VPILFTVICFYLLIFSWLPIGSLGKKAVLWVILGIPGIWWIDIRIDGVKRGYQTSRNTPFNAAPTI